MSHRQRTCRFKAACVEREESLGFQPGEKSSEMESQTDWEALQKKTEEEIEQAVQDDPDAILLDEEWFEKAKLVVPASDKERITIRLDEDIVEHFKQGGPGHQSRINNVLRAYVTAKRFGERIPNSCPSGAFGNRI